MSSEGLTAEEVSSAISSLSEIPEIDRARLHILLAQLCESRISNSVRQILRNRLRELPGVDELTSIE